MPRRVAGPIWAIRITMDITPEEETLFKVPNTVCVYHAGGARAKGIFKEKPHYHLYYNAGVEVTKEQVQDMLKSNEVVKKYYKASNGFWSVDTDEKYDLEGYWKYVWDKYPTKKQRLIWWDIPEPQLPIPDCIVPGAHVVALGPLDEYRGRVVTYKKNTKTSHEKQELFLQYCRDYYESKPTKPKTSVWISYLLVKYCAQKGFTPESSLSTWARYAYINILEKPERKLAMSDLASKLHDKFF